MTTKKLTASAAPRAEYATKDVTPLMQEYADWLTEQTGYPVDARSVFIGSALRVAFQKANRATARDRQADAEFVEVKPKRTRSRKGSTIAATGHDGAPVVIAETRHIDLADGAK